MMIDKGRVPKKRGRPVGHRLSKYTKDKIKYGRLGTHHSKETKNKISKSLTAHFKKRDLLSSNIEYEYGYLSKEVFDWICDNKDAIDDTDCVLTKKKLAYVNQVEVCLGNDIENLFGHATTPEFLLLLKEKIAKAFGKDRVAELCSLL